MIGKLYGTIDDIENNYIILKVNNIGYIVYVTSSIIQNYKLGDYLALFIDTYMREDQIKLYGFHTKEELSMLRTLIKVKGVSHKIATNIISEIPSEQIIQGIISKNTNLLKVTGVGLKVAKRIITELEGTIEEQCISSIASNNNLNSDAISALVNLGYNATESYKIVTEICNKNPHINDINELIRTALKGNEKK